MTISSLFWNLKPYLLIQRGLTCHFSQCFEVRVQILWVSKVSMVRLKFRILSDLTLLGRYPAEHALLHRGWCSHHRWAVCSKSSVSLLITRCIESGIEVSDDPHTVWKESHLTHFTTPVMQFVHEMERPVWVWSHRRFKQNLKMVHHLCVLIYSLMNISPFN